MNPHRIARLARTARVAVALLLAGAAACHPRSAAPRLPLTPRGAPTTEASKAALNAAMASVSLAGIDSLFDPDASLGAPGAEDPRGPTAIATYLVSARDGWRIEGFEFLPDRMVQLCPDGDRFEHGRVGIRMYDITGGESVPTAVGRYSLRWRLRGDRHLITRMSFEEGETIRPLDAETCPPPRVADYRGYRHALSLSVGAIEHNSVPGSIDRGFADAGWRQYSPWCVYLCIDQMPARRRLDAVPVTITGEYRIHEAVALLAAVERGAGETWAARETSDEYHRVHLRHRSMALFVAPEAQWKYFGLAIGPTVSHHWWKVRDDIFRQNEGSEARRLVYRSTRSASTQAGFAVQGRAGIVLASGIRLDLAARHRVGGAIDSPETEQFPSTKVGGNATALSIGVSYIP